jgi:threonine dehydrogenase-like Zn-dependent dehydrogenase
MVVGLVGAAFIASCTWREVRQPSPTTDAHNRLPNHQQPKVSNMQQLNYVGTRQLEWREAPLPTLTKTSSALVRPTSVSTCDMDGVVIHGMIKMKGAIPLGHEGIGVVTAVGEGVSRVRVGDRVVMPWKIACGSCKHCGRGFSAQCETVPVEDAYGWGPSAPQWGGFLSELIEVPWADFMLTKVPDGLDEVLACGVADNITDGWRAVAPALKSRPGGTVLVVGAAPPGSIGLYAAGIAVALGSERVVYADHDPTRLGMAAKMGCEVLDLEGSELAKLTGSFDVTVDASGVAEYLTLVLKLTGRAGVCTSTAGIVYRGSKVLLPAYEMYRNSVTFHTGWVHTHLQLDEPLELIRSGRFDPSPVNTAVVSWDAAIDALTQPFTKVIVTRA